MLRIEGDANADSEPTVASKHTIDIGRAYDEAVIVRWAWNDELDRIEATSHLAGTANRFAQNTWQDAKARLRDRAIDPNASDG